MTIATIDEGRLIDVNERAIELSGYSREEMIGRTSIEIGLWAYPRERDRLIAILRETGSLRDGMAHFQDQGGGGVAGPVVRRCHSAGRKKGAPHDHPRHHGAGRGAGKAAGRARRKYRLLAENVTDVIWTADLNLEFTYVSPSSERVFGWSPSEWMSLEMRDFLPPDRSSGHADAARAGDETLPSRTPTEPRVIQVELEMYRKDGSTRWFEVSARAVRDGNGKPISFIGVTRDIDARKKAEKALRESEEKYRQLIETCPIGIAICDLDRPIPRRATGPTSR